MPQCAGVIVGDGNSAGQAAIYLSEHASRVLLLILGDDLGAHMSHYLKRRIEQTQNIEVRADTQINEMHGDEMLKRREPCAVEQANRLSSNAG